MSELNNIFCKYTNDLIYIYLHRKMNIKKHIPNAITCCNLLCGCLALVQAFEGNLVYAAYLVGMGAIFDFFDGFAARMLKVSSPIGKDLDSLTDMVTFGVVPGAMMYKIALFGQQAYVEEASIGLQIQDNFWSEIIPLFCFVLTIFSAIRLAKFNNDTRQTDSFIGVPTPAIAIFVCSLVLVYGVKLPQVSGLDAFYAFLNNYPEEMKNVSLSANYSAPSNLEVIKLIIAKLFVNTVFNVLLCVIFSSLLVSELPLFALKFKHFKWAGNEIRFMFLGLSLVMLITLQFVGIPLIIIMYILLSVINNIISKKKVV
jgi:CDP-diacylglycerol--serine O-phosphatidyltransferase